MQKPKSGTLRIAVAGALALAAGLHAAVAQAQSPRTLTMQASWPAASMFMDNFNQFADRVNKTTAGRLQIKASAAGMIVPAF
jgi:TRAP-type mannitol/chloroaromatic compound transport system substrate-binding protein